MAINFTWTTRLFFVYSYKVFDEISATSKHAHLQFSNSQNGKITWTSSEHYWCHHGNSLLLFNFVYVVNILIKGFSRVRKLYSHKTEYWSKELEAKQELMFLYLLRAYVQIIDICISPICSIILCLMLWLPFFSSTTCKFLIQFTALWKSCITWQKCYPYK